MALIFGVPDTQLSLTSHNRRNAVIDQVYQGKAFTNAMAAHGGFGGESGGLELVTPLRMSKSTAGGSFSGYDLLDTTPQDNETSAKCPWAHEYQTAAMSWVDKTNNQGEGKIIDWAGQKTEDAMMALHDRLNVRFMAAQPAAGSKDPISITEVIDVAPTADPPRTSSIGSIGNANTWWRNKQLTGGAFTVADWTTMWNTVSDGEEFSKFLLTSSTIWEYYHNSLTGLVRYGGAGDRTGDQGFTDLLFMKAPVVWDPQIGITDAVYFINTDFLKIQVHPEGDYQTGDWIEPDNQAAATMKILWKGNLECNNRRRQGVVSAITAPA